MDQLKDVILSTLAEIQEVAPIEEKEQKETPRSTTKVKEIKKEEISQPKEHIIKEDSSEELLFLNSLRERMLVLFEGFQAPNNSSLEAKIDLTLNFLEYALSSIDARIQQIKGK
jgi:hypothetical protein